MTTYLYTLSVGAMFKNEEHAIVEWIEHYLYHGVQHFYLINDGSTDTSIMKLQPYIDKGLITLFNVDCKYYLGRQMDLYNTHILPHLKESHWLLMVDLDEFVWSSKSIILYDILKDSYHLGQIQVRASLFYSNGHTKQPKSIVEGFTKRDIETPVPKDKINIPGLKYFINSNYEFSSLNVHHAKFLNVNHDKSIFIKVDPEWFCLNHYICQSREFWNSVKCTRGDSDNYTKRTPEDFDKLHESKEEVEDTDLLEQNRPLLEKLGLLDAT
jgi:hypothetical protein